MSKIKVVFVTLLLAGFISVHSSAQQLVAFPTGDASWTVDIQPQGPPNSNIRLLQKAEITQLNNVKRIVLTWSDGKTTEKWSIPGLPVTFIQDPRNGAITPFRTDSESERTATALLTYDGFAFTWITADMLQEKTPISYEGKQCYHYSGTVTPRFFKTAFKREAWIDATTLLPVAYNNGTSMSTYTFAPKPPAGPLHPPPNFQTAIHYYKITMGYP